jgi:hypothetical protein
MAQKYIQVNMLVFKQKNKSMTEKEMDKFLDDYISLVEKHKYFTVGGMKVVTEKELLNDRQNEPRKTPRRRQEVSKRKSKKGT